MSDCSNESSDTASRGYAFDLPEYNLRGLRIFVGSRRKASVCDNPSVDRLEWLVRNEDDEDREQNDLGFDRGFIGPRNPLSKQMGQAINLALRMMETQKSIDIMTGVVERLIHDRSLQNKSYHITPLSTREEIQTLARNWIEKLRRQELFKMRLAHLKETNSGAHMRDWRRFVDQEPATLADYYPHNAGLLTIDVKIVEKFANHASSSHAHSPIEHEKCLFQVANLIINQAQKFRVVFLIPDQAISGAKEPVSVHSKATAGLLNFYSAQSSAYHSDAEFFGGVVRMCAVLRLKTIHLQPSWCFWSNPFCWRCVSQPRRWH